MKKSGMVAMLIAAATMLPASALAQAASGSLQPQSQVQVPQPADGGVDWKGAGYGAAALFGNLLYIPAKIVYAAGGGLVGGGSYLVTGGNKQVADTIWRSSLGGDYVLTPDMIQGKKPVYFSGPNNTSPPPPNAPAGYSGSIAPSSSAASGPSVANNGVTSAGVSSSSMGSSGSRPSNSGGSSSGGMDPGAGPVHHGVQAAPLPGTSIQ